MQGFDTVVRLGDVAWSRPWGPVEPGYLDAATRGLPMDATRDAVRAAIDRWDGSAMSVAECDVAAERARASYARIVGVPRSEVASAEDVAGLVAAVAADLPDGSEVLCADGADPAIITAFQQHAHRGVVVRRASLAALAAQLRPGTTLVAFPLVHADGRAADASAIADAAARHDITTLCDTTQAAGIFPVDAAEWDVTVCRADAWLCAPRGTAFLTSSREIVERVTPADDASPARIAWVGAAEALRHFETVDPAAAWGRATSLADELLQRLGHPKRHRAIVELADADGRIAAALEAADVTFGTGIGSVRLGFHLWNTAEDVDLVAAAIARTARIAA